MAIRAVFFDMDGVLTDSLDAHLRYCRRIASDLGLDLRIPDAREFKDSVVRSGARISPMLHFFRAVGFSPEDARRGDERYRAEFADEPVELFAGVEQVLSRVTGELGLPIGLVTSNVRSVVVKTLGPLLQRFRADCVFADDDAPRRTKAEAIEAGARTLGLAPAELLFVGDQLSDREAAQKAGVEFLGVSYGWGIASEDTDFPSVSSPQQIAAYVEELV